MSEQFIDMLEAVQRPQVARLQEEVARLTAVLDTERRRANALAVEVAELRAVLEHYTEAASITPTRRSEDVDREIRALLATPTPERGAAPGSERT